MENEDSAIDLFVVQNEYVQHRKKIESRTHRLALKRYLQHRAKQFYFGKDLEFYTELTSEEYADLINMLKTMRMLKRPPIVKLSPHHITMHVDHVDLKVTVYINNVETKEMTIHPPYTNIFQQMVNDKKFTLANTSFEYEYIFTTALSETEAFAISAIPLLRGKEIDDVLDRLSEDRSNTIEELAIRYINSF